MKNREQVIAHPSQLNALTALPFFRTNGVGTLRLGGNIAEHGEKKRWESELNRYFYACGCDTSAKTLIIGLIAGGAWAGYSYSQGKLGIGMAIGVALSIAVGAAILGKLYGLFRANARLKHTVREIQEQWKPAEKPEAQQWECG